MVFANRRKWICQDHLFTQPPLKQSPYFQFKNTVCFLPPKSRLDFICKQEKLKHLLECRIVVNYITKKNLFYSLSCIMANKRRQFFAIKLRNCLVFYSFIPGAAYTLNLFHLCIAKLLHKHDVNVIIETRLKIF